MKQVKSAKKLALNKTTVTNLSKENMSQVYAGSSTDVIATVIIGIAAYAWSEGVADGRANRK